MLFFYRGFYARQDGHGGDPEHHDHHLRHFYSSFSLQLCDSDRPSEPSSDCQVSLFLVILVVVVLVVVVVVVEVVVVAAILRLPSESFSL